MHFIDENQPVKSWEYAVLVCNTDYEVAHIGQRSRDRADCKNDFDEIKNQWVWGGYTTHDFERCALSARGGADFQRVELDRSAGSVRKSTALVCHVLLHIVRQNLSHPAWRGAAWVPASTG